MQKMRSAGFLPDLAVLLAICCGIGAADAEPAHRSGAAIRAFKAQSPCPATGSPKGSCPGWVIDHVYPLCAGGADDPGNMQWQTAEDAKAKDKWEWELCRTLKRHENNCCTNNGKG